MPELPEVQTVTAALNYAIKNLVVKNIHLNRKDLRYKIPLEMKKYLPGAKVIGVNRRAKYGIIYFDNGYVIIFHLGMSGSIIIENNLLSNFNKHDHIVFDLIDASSTNNKIRFIYRDARRFGFFLFYKINSIKFKNYFNRFGEEPLSENFSIPLFYKLIKNKDTSIKSALLDQNIIAGLGNIYVCESLFYSGIRPTIKCKRLSYNKVKYLYEKIVEVLKRAIKEGGTSIQDHKNITGEIGYFQNYLSVYNRNGEECINKNCNIIIKKIIQNGRSSFYCQNCQK